MTKLPENFELDRYGLHCRLVNDDDAELITNLRSDEKLGRYIHSTPRDVASQIEWQHSYYQRQKEGIEYYFAYEKGGVVYGFNRIYHITEEYFTIGSWVFSKESPIGMAILADIIVREIGFELFPEKLCAWDNRKDNTNVVKFSKTYNPRLMAETEMDYYFLCSAEDVETNKFKYVKLFNRNY